MTISRLDAPGELGLVQAFGNSACLLHGMDSFADPVAAADSLRRQGFPGDWRKLDEAARTRLIRVRELIRDHLGDPDRAETAAELTEQASDCLCPPGWSAEGRPVLRPRAQKGVEAVLGHVLAALFTCELTGETTRLKPCRAPDCRWLFYDRSPAGNSVWCSMETCGARHKMRAYRTRRSAR